MICAGLSSLYCIVNCETGQHTDLFPIETDNVKPIVKRVSKVCCNVYRMQFIFVTIIDLKVVELMQTLVHKTLISDFMLECFFSSGGVSTDGAECPGDVCDVRGHLPATSPAVVGAPAQCGLRSPVHPCHER